MQNVNCRLRNTVLTLSRLLKSDKPGTYCCAVVRYRTPASGSDNPKGVRQTSYSKWLRFNVHGSSQNMRVKSGSRPIFSSRLYSNKPDTDGQTTGDTEEKLDHADNKTGGKNLTSKERLKIITTQYGAFGMVFHITISLASLGLFYFLVYSGVDFTALMGKFGIENSAMTAGASTFIVAYAVHKVFAPIRIGITFVSVPVLVRYLRKVGLFKK